MIPWHAFCDVGDSPRTCGLSGSEVSEIDDPSMETRIWPRMRMRSVEAGIARGLMARRRAFAARLAGLMLILLVTVPGVVFGGHVTGQKKHPTRSEDPSYQAVFTRIAGAWRDGDQKALAGLVHPDGLKIITGGSPERAVNYSASQAFYYFRNLFQNSRTVSFTMARIQDSPQGERVHGLADWRYRSGRRERTARLVIVLARHEDRWFLSEITTIK